MTLARANGSVLSRSTISFATILGFARPTSTTGSAPTGSRPRIDGRGESQQQLGANSESPKVIWRSRQILPRLPSDMTEEKSALAAKLRRPLRVLLLNEPCWSSSGDGGGRLALAVQPATARAVRMVAYRHARVTGTIQAPMGLRFRERAARPSRRPQQSGTASQRESSGACSRMGCQAEGCACESSEIDAK